MKNYLIAFAVVIPFYVLFMFYLRQRVIKYVKNNYQNITGLSVCWTLFGPIGPGSGHKFYVRLSINNDQYITFYAMTSLFGEVFVSKESD